jgi:hypothetical protein
MAVAGRWLIAGLFAAACSWSATARAQGDIATADALWKAGRDLAARGDWAGACPKFQASFDLDEQLGTLLNLADCYNNLGKIATAWARWNTALEWAKRTNDSRLDFIQKEQQKTEANLPRVTVEVANPVPTLTIKRGTTVVEPAMWGVPIPTDPGPVEIVVFRGDTAIERTAIEAKVAEVAVVKLDLEEIDRRHPKPIEVPKPTPDPIPIPKPAVEPYDPTQRNIGLIVGGVGIAAVLTAAGLEIAALVKKNQAEEPDACINKFCSPDGLAAAEEAATFAEVGQWVGIGGLAVFAVGVTIFLTAPSEDDPAVARVVPWFAPGGGGLELEARF